MEEMTLRGCSCFHTIPETRFTNFKILFVNSFVVDSSVLYIIFIIFKLAAAVLFIRHDDYKVTFLIF